MRSCFGSEIDSVRLAGIAALIVLIGDALALISACAAIRELDDEQKDSKKQFQQQLEQMQAQLDKLKHSW